MHEVADGVFHLPLLPRDGINVYLVGDVLVDAGIRPSAGRILGALAGRPLRAHAITHVHTDHVGASKAVAERRGVPVWAPAGDAAALEEGLPEKPTSPVMRLLRRPSGFPAVTPARRLAEGDDLGHGFAVLDTPGHSTGHVAFWRAADRTLICGDVFFNLHPLTTRPGLREPPGPLTLDPARNRESMRRLAALEPAVVCFGHGPVLRDGAALQRFAATL